MEEAILISIDAIMNSVDTAAVTRALQSEGLEIIADEDAGLWTMSFEYNTRKQVVMLSAPGSSPVFSEYLLAVSFISSGYLVDPIERLPASTLRIILAAQASVLLAKFDYWSVEGKTHYVTVSPCSVVGFDGPKLRKRLESCADLASRIRVALLEQSTQPTEPR